MPPSSAFDVKSRPKKAPLLPKLRGQFAEFLNRDSLVALACSASLPVSVYGTGTYDLPRGFSWQRGVSHFGTEVPRIRFSELIRRGFTYDAPYLLKRTHPSVR